jgi:hypothetical protein
MRADLTEPLSMEHTHVSLGKIIPQVGDSIMTTNDVRS